MQCKLELERLIKGLLFPNALHISVDCWLCLGLTQPECSLVKLNVFSRNKRAFSPLSLVGIDLFAETAQ